MQRKGILPDGARLFTLKNTDGTEISITNYGAIITSLRVKTGANKLTDIVLGFDNLEDYVSPDYLDNYPWFGAAIGRYANRIANAKARINGHIVQLKANHGQHQLHGGAKGFDKKLWEVRQEGNKPFPFIELSYTSVDGEEGFPGNLQVSLRFELNDDNELSYEFKATTDTPTCVNLTHHDYFNLDGSGTIANQLIHIPASQYLEQDKDLVATGNLIPVNNTPYDFRTFSKPETATLITGEYDKSFVVESNDYGLVAEARSTLTGIFLQVYSSEPVVHFYAGKWIPDIMGKNGELLGPHSGFCFEAHSHPNAVNIEKFPDTTLLPGQTYYQKTVYRISKWSAI